MPEEAKDKGRLWEEERKCRYCGETRSGESLGLKHTSEEGKVDWAICFWCIKKFFDKVLDKKTEVKEYAEKSITKCSYCGVNTDKYLLNFDINNNLRWFVCFECVKKAFDKVMKGE